MKSGIFAFGMFATVGLLFLALFAVAVAAPASPALWALTGAAGFCFVVMLLFFMAAAQNNS